MAAPLRITIVQGAFLPVPPLLGGAVEKAWHALGTEFARDGHRVVHVSRSYPGLPVADDDSGVSHRRVPGHDMPRALWRLKLLDLRYTLRVRRVLPVADILVSNTFWLPVVERRRSRGRLYLHVARHPRGQLKLYPRSAILQAVSTPVRDAILRELPAAAGRVRVVPYPLAPASLAPAAAEPGRVILYAGRIHPEKGLHLLIAAFGRLASGCAREWTLRIVGPWETAQGGGGAAYRDALQAAAARAGGRIEIAGPVFGERELAAVYRRAAIFVYPSLAERGETFGLAVLEAMAGGCVPVVSALACFGDFVRPRQNGLVFAHRGPDPAGALADALQEALLDARWRREAARAARETACGYALPEIALRFLRDFSAVMERPAAARS